MTITKQVAMFLYDAYGGDLIVENDVIVGFDFTLDAEQPYLKFLETQQRPKKNQAYMTAKRYNDKFIYYRVDCPETWFKGVRWK